MGRPTTMWCRARTRRAPVPTPRHWPATPIAPPTFTSSATASPNPVTQGAGTTITAKVTCTARSLSERDCADPGDRSQRQYSRVAEFHGAELREGPVAQLLAGLQPALAGTYTWKWASSARHGSNGIGTLRLERSRSIVDYVHLFGDGQPSTIAVGGTSNISATVTETGPRV
jgi:hypothetical protein